MSQVLTLAPIDSPSSSPRVAAYRPHAIQLPVPPLLNNYKNYSPATLTVNSGMANAHAYSRRGEDTMDYETYQAPVASTSQLPVANGKSKQSEPIYVNLPNTTPRSYTILKEVGDGSFGTVWLADWHSPLELPPGTAPPGPSSRPEYAGKRLVAIKRMKKAFNGGWDECMKLKELHSLRTIASHPNIIPLYDAFLQPESRELYFVFECMEGNLYQLTKSRKGRPLAGGLIANIFQQILHGLHHIHSSGFFHRDMKPENLLITTTGLADYPPSALFATTNLPYEKDVLCTVKLADFGLARETKSSPPYTEYVSTRWYRAPEVLLRSRDYSNPVDMWALGTILAELVNLKPLFPGQSEIDQVIRICEILGDPATDYGKDSMGNLRGGGTWAKGIKMAKTVGFQWPKHAPVNFSSLFDTKTVSAQLIDCIIGCLRYEPQARYTTQDCLAHPFFRDIAPRLQPLAAPLPQQIFPPTPSTGQSMQRPLYPVAHLPISPPPSGQPHAVPDEMSRANWQAARHASLAGSVQSLPESILSSDGYSPHVPWERQPVHQHLAIPRRPTAASSIDFYDGSIFEGITPTRDASVYNFHSLRPHSRGSSFAAPSIVPSALNGQLREDRLQEDMRLAQQSPSKTSKGWSLSSVLRQDTRAQSSTRDVTSANLKRTTSQRSAQLEYSPPQSSIPVMPETQLDPKKAKKEAEKAAKLAERARREAATLAARERARAVMQKKNQLQPSLKDENWFSAPPKANPARAQESARSQAMAKIPEYPHSLLPPDHRSKSRRRDDDDDVHSVSSNETRHSGERRYSAVSHNTMDSDPGPRYSWNSNPNAPISRITTASSYGSTGSRRLHSGRPPPSAGSSVDLHLAQGFQGLSATDGGFSDGYSMATSSLGVTAPAIHSLAYRPSRPIIPDYNHVSAAPYSASLPPIKQLPPHYEEQ